MHNDSQPILSDGTPNSGSVLAQSKAVAKLGKSHVNYWKKALVRRAYVEDGRQKLCGNLSVRICVAGRREWFAIATLDRDVGALKAKQIYETIKFSGWEAALEQFKPKREQNTSGATVGTLLAEVSSKSGLKERTFRTYASSLRRIVSDIFEIAGGKEKFDYRAGGAAAWRGRVDEVKLADVTADQVQQWKVGYLKEFETNPAKQRSAKQTVNAHLRGARSLFKASHVKFLSFPVPQPSPFHQVTLEKIGSMRYVSTINLPTLVAAARQQLRPKHPERYKIFLLGLFCGLRRAEIDGLQKEQLDFENGLIRVTTSEVLSVKTDGSEGIVEVEPQVMGELRALTAKGTSNFVIESHRESRVGLDRQYYRCEHHFEELTEWLRGKGVRGNKPLHTLRKEFGSAVNQKHGIYAAAQALRHSDITTSARYYVAKKERVTAGLGHLLAESVIRSSRNSKRGVPPVTPPAQTTLANPSHPQALFAREISSPFNQ